MFTGGVQRATAAGIQAAFDSVKIMLPSLAINAGARLLRPAGNRVR